MIVVFHPSFWAANRASEVFSFVQLATFSDNQEEP
jgi:hypothetical protein